MLEENIKNVLKDIKEVCNKLNKDINQITVVAATKMQDAQTVFCLPRNGINICGENKVQELLDKYDKGEGVEWHFIGRLQTNKVKYIIDKVTLIHSVDRINLCEEIDKQAKKHNKVMDVLLEINIADEQSKAGFAEGEIAEALQLITENYKNVNVVGFMTVLPYFDNPYDNKELYQKVYSLYKHFSVKYENFKYLSMGMSNDYKLAIECGSNMVRIGTGIFGARNYT